jgi:hypothetical protein
VFRPTALKLVLGVILVAGTYFMCINAHIDIFPCTQTLQDLRAARIETRDGTCSLLQTQGDYFRPPEHAELTPAGYGVAFLVVGVAPLLAGFVFGNVFGRRRE